VDVGAAVVADEQAAEVVQPGEDALDDPAEAAKAGAVACPAARDLRLDATLPELAAVGVVVVAAVRDQTLRAPTRPAHPPANAWHSVDQRKQLGDIVAVPAGQRPGQRKARGIDEQMLF
jgi:hypothetical protein